ncbi:MAG: hypothetical protein U1F08_04715 [Steroidobacteraceae bacterium]
MRIRTVLEATARAAVACAATLLVAGTRAAAPVVAAPEQPSATEPGDPVVEARNGARSKRISRAIFVCAESRPVTFADRPCGPLPERRVLTLREPPAGSAPGLGRPAATASTRPAERRTPETVVPDPREDRCRRLLAQRDAINERMRAGYSARQAAQLWTRWRDVGREIYASRC